METKTEAASFAATNLEPDAVITGIPNADHAWKWGVRWPTEEGHVDMWLASEDAARDLFRTTRGQANLVRKMVIDCPAEVVP